MFLSFSNLLVLSVFIFYLISSTNAFPFFHFHKSEINNVTNVLDGKTPVGVNAPFPELSSLLVPTEALKSEADANLRRLIELIKNANNNGDLAAGIQNLLNSASVITDPKLTVNLNDVAGAAAAAAAAIIEPGENMIGEPKVTILKIGEGSPINGEETLPKQRASLQIQRLPLSALDDNQELANVAVIGVKNLNQMNQLENLLNNKVNVNTVPDNNIVRNEVSGLPNVEQTTLSEIWLELNKILSGDIPEDNTLSPLAGQANGQASSVNLIGLPNGGEVHAIGQAGIVGATNDNNIENPTFSETSRQPVNIFEATINKQPQPQEQSSVIKDLTASLNQLQIQPPNNDQITNNRLNQVTNLLNSIQSQQQPEPLPVAQPLSRNNINKILE